MLLKVTEWVQNNFAMRREIKSKQILTTAASTNNQVAQSIFTETYKSKLWAYEVASDNLEVVHHHVFTLRMLMRQAKLNGFDGSIACASPSCCISSGSVRGFIASFTVSLKLRLLVCVCVCFGVGFGVNQTVSTGHCDVCRVVWKHVQPNF